MKEGVITSLAGIRENPVTGKREFHDGVDIGCPVGTEVFAAFNGTVQAAGRSASFGKYVRLAYSNGYSAFYAHLSEYGVQTGDLVSRGQVVALTGNTGRSTGPHLHYSLSKDSQYVDASDYVALPFNERIVAAGSAN